MDNIGLGILLWLAYICFFSCLFCTPSSASVQAPKKKQTLTIEQEVKQLLEEEIPATLSFPPPANIAVTDTRILEVIGKLTKRQARQLCKPLGIQQKCNNVELTTELMQGAIKKVYKDNPTLVVATLREKQPALLPAETTELPSLWEDAV